MKRNNSSAKFHTSMRISLLLFLLLFPVCSTFSQIEGKMLDFGNKLEISLEKLVAEKSLGHRYHSVQVIDVRDDTAAIGFYSVSRLEAAKYMLKAGSSPKKENTDAWSRIYHYSPSLQEGLGDWINEYLQCRRNDSVKNKLLVVVKKLWLSYQAEKARFDDTKISAAIDGWDAGVLCKLEFYLERDSVFYPLYRVDSVFTFKDVLYDYAGMRFVDNGPSFLTITIKNAVDRLQGIEPGEIIGKRRRLSFADIRQEYSRKKDLLVLQATTLNKGVYTTYDEFKNNAPSIQEFQFKTGPMGDVLYVKEGAQEYPTRNVWGYCNGTDIFINSGDKYSKLLRHENIFYFYGVKEIARRSKIRFMKASGLSYSTNSGEKKSVYVKNMKYFMLDMESGEVY